MQTDNNYFDKYMNAVQKTNPCLSYLPILPNTKIGRGRINLIYTIGYDENNFNMRPKLIKPN